MTTYMRSVVPPSFFLCPLIVFDPERWGGGRAATDSSSRSLHPFLSLPLPQVQRRPLHRVVQNALHQHQQGQVNPHLSPPFLSFSLTICLSPDPSAHVRYPYAPYHDSSRHLPFVFLPPPPYSRYFCPSVFSSFPNWNRNGLLHSLSLPLARLFILGERKERKEEESYFAFGSSSRESYERKKEKAEMGIRRNSTMGMRREERRESGKARHRQARGEG
jgi:hypothetical protein